MSPSVICIILVTCLLQAETKPSPKIYIIKTKSVESDRDYNYYVEHGNDYNDEQGDDSSIEQGHDSSIEQGDDPNIEQGDDSNIKQGDDPNIEQGDDPNIEQGDDSNIEQGHDSSIKQGDDSNIEQGDDSNIEQEHDSSIEQGDDSNIKQEHDSSIEQGDDSNIEQGDEDNIVNGDNPFERESYTIIMSRKDEDPTAQKNSCVKTLLKGTIPEDSKESIASIEHDLETYCSKIISTKQHFKEEIKAAVQEGVTKLKFTEEERKCLDSGCETLPMQRLHKLAREVFRIAFDKNGDLAKELLSIDEYQIAHTRTGEVVEIPTVL